MWRYFLLSGTPNRWLGLCGRLRLWHEAQLRLHHRRSGRHQILCRFQVQAEIHLLAAGVT